MISSYFGALFNLSNTDTNFYKSIKLFENTFINIYLLKK